MERKSLARSLTLFFFLLAVSLLLILAENLGWLKPIRGTTEKLTVPVRTGFYRLGQNLSSVSSVLGDWRTKPQKIAEMESLIRELSVLKVKDQALEEENKSLRRQLEAPLPANMQFLPAKTLGKTRYLTIDKGEDDGVKLGMMVVSENILVGKIISLTPRTSNILLPSDPDSKIAARSLKTQAHGLATGQFGTSIFLDKVLQSDNLETEDLVVTTGDDDYSRGLLIGHLGKLEKREVEPFQRAEILPLIDYGKLVNVFVIK